MRRDIVLVALLALMTCVQCKAQTFISGVISVSTAWTLPGSPYVVTGNTVLAQGATLTIEPGVIVQFNADVAMDVRGTLLALGTLSDSVRFVPSGSARWSGFNLNNGLGGRIRCEYVHAHHADLLFRPLSNSGPTDTILVLRHSMLHDNNVAVFAADVTKSYKVYSESCVFSENLSSNTGAGNATYISTLFLNNSDGPYNSSGQATIVDSCEFIGNTRALLVAGTITNSEFHGNDQAISTMQTNGTFASDNLIYDNGIGIYAWNYFVNQAGQIAGNTICGNTYNVKKAWAADTYLPGNCWCLDDSASVAETMYDFFADASLGIVFFTPFETDCSLAASTPWVDEMEDAVLSITPNPFLDHLRLALSSSSEATIRVLDMSGRLYFQRRFRSELLIEASVLRPGAYLVEVITVDGVLVRRVVKE